MELKFTKGPWKVSEASDALHAVRAMNGQIIADVGYSGSLEGDAANAQAIAALPDLAAALLAILREVTPGPVPPFSADSYLPEHLIEQARAALEKAEVV